MTEQLPFKKRFLLAQSEIKSIAKDAENSFFKKAGTSKPAMYTSLPSALEAILPPLQKYDLLYHTEIVKSETGSLELITYIEDVHSDMFKKTVMPLLDMKDMQKIGSSITYAQRYSILSVMGLCAGIDDDGNIASGVVDEKQNKQNKQEVKQEVKKPIDLKMLKNKQDELKEILKSVENTLPSEWKDRINNLLQSSNIDAIEKAIDKINEYKS
jgi:hypothetical protein